MNEDAKPLLQKIASDQAAALRILATLESRLDILREEHHRTSAIVHRLKLAQDNEKARARRPADAMTDLKEGLARIEKLLTPPPGA